MNPEKVNAERDALLLALRRAEEEIARSRSAQQKAEAKLGEILSGRMPMVAPVRNDGNHTAMAQAHAAQKRAETTTRTLEERIHRQNAELTDLRIAFDALKAENDALRSKAEALEKQEKPQPGPKSTLAPAQPTRNETRSLRDELDKAWSEIHRLRALVVKVASEARKGIVPEEPFPAPSSQAVPPAAKPAPKSGAVSRPAPYDCVPKSGARRAA